ncbi:peroxiredoxin [Candidatus Magnetaquicoccus inordinatus]|uniref:peroxiredoxin n=1 Tax=Candidatus Magnetaquicoccus inordinatus TaxID=2496818 RepID=UPI00102B421C|nr:peroxiredoxin [Candidatus Magnetaquicoccus inordinatus]
MLEIGASIPDLILPDQQNQPRPLRQLLGAQGAIFYFYPKDNTPGCTVEANDFQALQSDFATLGYTVIGLSKDSVASHDKFCQKFGLTFTLLSDTNTEACVASDGM